LFWESKLILDIAHNIIEIYVIFIYFTFFGTTLHKIINKANAQIPDLIQLNLLGLFANYLLLALWNIFFSINIHLGLLLIIPGILFIYYMIPRVQINEIMVKLKPIYFILFLIQLMFVIWIANRSLGLLKYEPMYQIQKIRWAQEYPLIKGLGNLFDHFGLDSGHFLHLALLDSFPFTVGSFWNFSGYLLALGFLYFFVLPLFNNYNEKRSPAISEIMRLLFTPILIHNCFYLHPGLGTDLPVFIFGSILAVEMFRIIFEGEDCLNIVLICIFLGFTSKMSFIPTAVISIIALVLFYYRNIYNIIRKNRLMVLLVIVGFSLQFHRNIILTGYPLYPFEGISVPVKWKMDKEEVGNLSKSISDWAKGVRPGNASEDVGKIKKEWLKSRLLIQHRRVETLYPLVFAFFGFVFIVYSKRLNWWKICIFILPVLGQVGMWYFYSPDTRFASFAFWWIGAGLASFAIKEKMSTKLVIIFPLAILMISFSFHVIDALGQKKSVFITQPLILNQKVPTINEFIMKSGFMVWVPENGGKCNDSPLPCTQSPDSNLKLIDGKNIMSGYYK